MILEINNVTKKYKNNLIFENVFMQIDRPKIVGLIGENGAGKTTLMKIILQLIEADYGEIHLFNSNNFKQEFYKNIGTLIEVPIFYGNLTAEENLSLHLKYMKTNKCFTISEVLKLVGLDEGSIRNKKVKNYSLGMKQRLGIARAIIHKPSLVILDEPVNGLDPSGVVEMRNLFSKLRSYNITFLISSHLLSELEMLADDIYILQNKRLQKLQKDNSQEKRWVITTPNSAMLVGQLISNFGLLPSQYKQLEGKVILEGMTPEIRQFIINNEQLVSGFSKYKESLEEKFINSQINNGGNRG